MRTRRVRTAAAILSVALGTGSVVWVMSCYESVKGAVREWAEGYVGNSEINIESPLGKYSQIPASLVARIEKVENVKAAVPLLAMRLRGYLVRRNELGTYEPPDRWTSPERDVHGLDLNHESIVREYNVPVGRFLAPDDDRICLLEQSVAEENGVGLGDYVMIWGEAGDQPVALEIVGLVQRRRIARFQKTLVLVRMGPLQEWSGRRDLITSIDVVLNDASPDAVSKASGLIRREVRRAGIKANVRSVQTKMMQIEKAEHQQENVLQLLAAVALLTSLCIMLSTLSIGLVERISVLGLLRCIGMTATQLAGLVLGQVVPLGAIGVALGVPIGLAMTWLTVRAVPEYFGGFAISWKGVSWAIVAGAITTLIAAVLPALAALTVSPLEASRPRARKPRAVFYLVAFALAAAAIGGAVWIITQRVRRDYHFVDWSTSAVVLLYIGYALAAPLIIWLFGTLAVRIVSRIVAVRTRILQDQVGYAVWRSAGVCCALMVGLSLIVGLIVFNQSFRGGWRFPTQFPEAYLFSLEQIYDDVAAELRQAPGVKNFTVANAANVIVDEKPLFGESVLRSVTWFLGCDPDTFFDLVHLEFIEGDEKTARELLKQGGYVVIAEDFARTRNKGVTEVRDEQTGKVLISNTVRVYFGDRQFDFKIAGVMNSPALDIAANYFQAESEMRVAATGSVMGTNADMKRLFGVEGTRLALLNFDLPPEPVPLDWPPPPGSPEARGLPGAFYESSVPPAQRWQTYREKRLLEDVRRRLRAQQVFVGTLRELKDEIDRELERYTRILSAVPIVALIIAALGVANLMTTSVSSRTRQLAILRAVGATRGLVLRMVIGEALVLGIIGSAMGLGLGIHLAWNVSEMAQRMWGFAAAMQIPWNLVGSAAVLTVALCMLAGALPARHASRTNVIDALHVA